MGYSTNAYNTQKKLENDYVQDIKEDEGSCKLQKVDRGLLDCSLLI